MAAGGSEIILSIRDVSKSFPGVKALDRVSIDVRRGTVHGIVGENGAGKSTLMKILSGVYQKDSGTIEFDGARVEHTTPHQSTQSGLAIIYQELNLVNTMSVGENVFLGRFKEMKGMRGTHARARELLDSIGCTVPTTRLVSELSVSEKQMVEIVKALSFSSKLIIMDEPSSSLTGEEMAELVTIIRQLKEKGISIIYISHKLDEIFQFCDIVSVMRDGRVVDTKAVAEFTRNELVSKMVGRTIENEYPPRPHSVGEVVMEVRSISTHKLHDISFTLHKGEILGLVGLVGAGRTEIVRAIYGADKARGHEVLLGGKPAMIRNPRHAKDFGIGLIPEDRKLQGLVLPFSVESNISMGSIRKFEPARLHPQVGGEGHRGATGPGPLHQDALDPGCREQSLRRQPAESHCRAVAGDLSADLHHGRADPGHRRRSQVRDLPPHETDRRGGRIDHPHLLGAPRGAQHGEPCADDLRRTDHRGVLP